MTRSLPTILFILPLICFIGALAASPKHSSADVASYTFPDGTFINISDVFASAYMQSATHYASAAQFMIDNYNSFLAGHPPSSITMQADPYGNIVAIACDNGAVWSAGGYSPPAPPYAQPSYYAQGSYGPSSCPTGQTLSNNACVLPCPLNVSGSACSGACPVGYVLSGGQCFGCPSGFEMQNNQCVAIAIGGSCTAQYECKGSDQYHKAASCVETRMQTCQYGCSGGACLGVPAPTATIQAVPSLMLRGNASTISWNSGNTIACKVSGSNGDGGSGWSSTAGSASHTSSAINSRPSTPLPASASIHRCSHKPRQ